MKILLDENLDWRLKCHLPGHDVEAVTQIGWAGLKNGKLLSEAEKRFDVLLTMDSKMSYQQNLAKYKIAVIALKAPSNRLADTQPLMPKFLAALPNVKPGTLTIIS